MFSKNDLPPPQSVPSELTNALDPFFEITRDIVTNREEANGPDAQPPLPLMPDGSAADPASIGFAVLLANWTNEDGGQVDYATAAQEQLDFLLTKTPRAPNGAISHRVSEAQLWYVLDSNYFECLLPILLGLISYLWYHRSWRTMEP